MPTPWSSLEQIPGLIALPSVWRKRTGDHFEPFKLLCLQAAPKPAKSFPCPLATSCAYRILPNPEKSSSSSSPSSVGPGIQHPASSIQHPASGIQNPTHPPSPAPPPSSQPPTLNSQLPFLGSCQRDPQTCPQIQLTLPDIIPLQVSLLRLARALCHALGCDAKKSEFGLPHTIQVGSWSADAVLRVSAVETYASCQKACRC